jgi:hypothetical protein
LFEDGRKGYLHPVKNADRAGARTGRPALFRHNFSTTNWILTSLSVASSFGIEIAVAYGIIDSVVKENIGDNPFLNYHRSG